MRYVADCNPNKRGCYICADTKKINITRDGKHIANAHICPYNECPYHELDDFKDYSEYDKHAKKQGKSQLEAWLKKVFNLSEK